jgi:hypothetical protein
VKHYNEYGRIKVRSFFAEYARNISLVSIGRLAPSFLQEWAETNVSFSPERFVEQESAWSRKGLYTYHVFDNVALYGDYVLLTIPTVPLTIDKLPVDVGFRLGNLCFCNNSFRETDKVSTELIMTLEAK